MISAPVELQVATNYSFLHGASHPRELALQAKGHGYEAIGIADRNTMAGIVRAYDGCNQAGSAWSSAAGSICRMHPACSAIRRTARPMAGFAPCSPSASDARKKANAS